LKTKVSVRIIITKKLNNPIDLMAIKYEISGMLAHRKFTNIY